MEAPPDSRELKLLRPARFDANYLVEIMRSREIGVPSFVVAGLLIPLGASIWRLMTGFTFDDWWVALVIGLVGVAIGVALSWIVLREAPWRAPASASRSEAAAGVWDSVGHCGRPPKDGSRRFAIISIVLMVGGRVPRDRRPGARCLTTPQPTRAGSALAQASASACPQRVREKRCTAARLALLTGDLPRRPTKPPRRSGSRGPRSFADLLERGAAAICVRMSMQ